MEQAAALQGVGHRGDCAVVVQVPAGSHVGEQEVVPDHRHQDVDVTIVEPHAAGDGPQQVDPDLGVVTRVALADVVEQRAHQQQVGPVHPVDETGRLRGRLHQVPVDGEAVVGVALGPGSARLPLRDHEHEQPHVVEVLDDRDGRWSGCEQRHKHLTGLVRPRHGQRQSVVGQSLQGPALQVGIVLGGHPRAPQHEERIAQVGLGRELQAPVVEHQAGGHLPTAQVAEGPERSAPTGGPPGAARRSLAGPGDSARRGGHLGHQDVGIGQVECRRHVILEFQQEAIGPLSGEAVELDADGQQRLGRGDQARRLDLPKYGHGGLFHPEKVVDVAQATPGLLEVRFEKEGHLPVSGMPLGD